MPECGDVLGSCIVVAAKGGMEHVQVAQVEATITNNVHNMREMASEFVNFFKIPLLCLVFGSFELWEIFLFLFVK